MSQSAKIRDLLTPGERRRAMFLLGLTLIGMVLETAGIGAVIPVMSLLTQNDLATRYPRVVPLLQALGNPSQATLVVQGMLALLVFFLIKALFLSLLIWRQMAFAYDVQAGLSQRLFTTYLRQPYTFHLGRNSAQLIRNAITEVSQFTFAVLLPGMLLLTEGLVLVGIAILLLVIEPVGAACVGLMLGVTAIVFHRLTAARVTAWGVARQVHEGLRIQHLQQGLGGAKDVKLLGREDDFLAKYQEHNLESARVGRLQMTLQQLPRLWLETLGVAALATLVVAMLAQGRDMAAIIPALALFGAASFRLMPSVNRLLGAVQGLRYGLPIISLLHEEMQLALPAPAVVAAGEHVLREGIALDDVEFRYPGSHVPAITALSLEVARGESVGVVGTSGSGKSTLVDVLLGLLTPQSGRVLVNGRDIQSNLRGWQNQVGYVPQSVFLCDDTLRRNVAFGLADEQIDESAVRRAIAAAQLEEFVASLPEGLDAVVGERGVRISGGQRQRIGIARALYHDPAVLVLDEATSALDSTTELGVMEAVQALHGRKTVLIVAHRLSTVAHCDRLYRLEQGRVVSTGSAATMLAATPAV